MPRPQATGHPLGSKRESGCPLTAGIWVSLDNCDDTDQAVHPGTIEDCTNNKDDDCDGATDYEDTDCQTILCGTTTCETHTSTARTWVRDECVEEEYINTTTYANPYCDDGVCAYNDVRSALDPTGGTRNVSGACSYGYCVNGRCLPPCETMPGCRGELLNGEVVPGYSCEQPGTACFRCVEGTHWNGERCDYSNHRIIINDILSEAGTTIILNPQTVTNDGKPVSGVIYYYNGFITDVSADPISITPATVGTHDVTITAKKVIANQEETLAEKHLAISIVCPAGVACCPAGEDHYAPPHLQGTLLSS